MKNISSLYFKPKTVISTFHSVSSAQPRRSVRPDLLPRVFCWDREFCASGTCSVILGQRAAGPWHKWCCNRNTTELTYEQQRWLESHTTEARNWTCSTQHLLRPLSSPSSRFLTEKGGQDSHLLVCSSQRATPACFAPCLFSHEQKMEEIQPFSSSCTGHSLGFLSYVTQFNLLLQPRCSYIRS